MGISQSEFMRSLVDHLASAEELGFETIWVNEHHFHALGGMAPSLSPILAALSHRTRRARLGTSTVLLPLHHPLQVAEELAMVDLLSGGRLDFGVGRGFVAHDYDVMGVPLEEARERFAESLEVILKAWTGEPFSHEGRFYQFRDLQLWPQPEQRPHPPVWIACTSNPESFQWTGAAGHKLLVIPFARPVERLAALTRVYREAWSAANHPAAAEIGAHYHVVVGEDREETRKTAEAALGMQVRLQYDVARLSASSAWAGFEEFTLERLVDEGRLIAGDPEDCIRLIRAVEREIGFTWLNCTFQFGGIPFARAQHSMELFAAEVAPRLKAAGELVAPG
jgi:natural product biosynthesis luciferase-like monooxygenase protein